MEKTKHGWRGNGVPKITGKYRWRIHFANTAFPASSNNHIGPIDDGLEPWKGQHGRQFSPLSENSKEYHPHFQYTWV
jgi:hypothetical protein